MCFILRRETVPSSPFTCLCVLNEMFSLDTSRRGYFCLEQLWHFAGRVILCQHLFTEMAVRAQIRAQEGGGGWSRGQITSHCPCRLVPWQTDSVVLCVLGSGVGWGGGREGYSKPWPWVSSL